MKTDLSDIRSSIIDEIIQEPESYGLPPEVQTINNPNSGNYYSPRDRSFYINGERIPLDGDSIEIETSEGPITLENTN